MVLLTTSLVQPEQLNGIPMHKAGELRYAVTNIMPWRRMMRNIQNPQLDAFSAPATTKIRQARYTDSKVSHE